MSGGERIRDTRWCGSRCILDVLRALSVLLLALFGVLLIRRDGGDDDDKNLSRVLVHLCTLLPLGVFIVASMSTSVRSSKCYVALGTLLHCATGIAMIVWRMVVVASHSALILSTLSWLLSAIVFIGSAVMTRSRRGAVEHHVDDDMYELCDANNNVYFFSAQSVEAL